MAATARGFLSKLRMGFETEFGKIPLSPKTYDLPFNSFGISLTQALNTAQTMRGTRNPMEPFAGNKDVSGDLVLPLDVICIGYAFRGLFGLPATTAGSTGDPNTHVFKIQNQTQSMWFETDFSINPTSYVQTTGVRFGSFSMDTGGDGELTCSFTAMGKDQSTSAASKAGSPVSPDFLRLNNSMGKLLLDDVECGIATSFGIKLDNGLDGDAYGLGGGGTRLEIGEGIAAVNGTISVLFQDMDLVNAALNGTKKKAQVVFERTEGSVSFDVQEMLLEPKTPAITTPSMIRLEMNWQGFHDSGALGSALAVTLTNTHTSYADA